MTSADPTRDKSLCITLTSPFVFNAFLKGHVARLNKSFAVSVCLNQLESDIRLVPPGRAFVNHIEIRREIAPWHDVAALSKLWKFYRDRRFDAVLTVTPKGGLLGMIAARIAGVPVRVHWFTGQIWATQRGLMRFILKGMDRIITACATHVLADSPSQRDFLVGHGVVPPDKISVLGQGSISGVDAARFRPDPAMRQKIRSELNIPNEALCLIYVGRMKKDKGILDLLEAFRRLRGELAHLYLLLVGPDEERLLAKVGSESLRVVGYTQHAEAYMAASDIICLPSYREGFGSVLIEGSACGLPAVASRIYGITDAVVENVTGLLHSPGDAVSLTDCLRRLLSDDQLRLALGDKARRRALESFTAPYVEQCLDRFLQRLLSGNSESTKVDMAVVGRGQKGVSR